MTSERENKMLCQKCQKEMKATRGLLADIYFCQKCGAIRFLCVRCNHEIIAFFNTYCCVNNQCGAAFMKRTRKELGG